MKIYKNLIFDIGNVIVDIDYEVVVNEFQKLATIDFSKIVSYTEQLPIFDWYETGKISSEKFRKELRRFLRAEVTDDEIDHAWNSIFIDYPKDKFDMLLRLKTEYRTLALSNINVMHADFLDEVARSHFRALDFRNYFHRAIYSHEIGYRKPDKKIFEAIISEETLNPSETFFVDDKEENVIAARSLGIQAFILKDRSKLHQLLVAEHII